MLRHLCYECKHYDVLLDAEPCLTCFPFAEAGEGRPKWESRDNYHQPKHDKVGERMRGDQRKGRPYIRRGKADLRGE
jgi:hypothetical protein